MKLQKTQDTISYLGKSLKDTYKTSEQREHVLKRPATYIGTITNSIESVWTYNDILDQIQYKSILFNEGLYKIYDEIISNAYDHFIRLNDLIKNKKDINISPVKNIKININKKTGEITVYNDGNGIDVVEIFVEREKRTMYVPEQLFTVFLSGTNYDDTEERGGVGQNGIGAKATAIFSKEFTIETVDHIRKLKYTQKYKDNLLIIEPPIIEKCAKTPYTQITFIPDYERFGIKLTDLPKLELWQVFERRIYDFTIYLEKNCQIWYNNTKIKCNSFEQYINLYIGSDKKETKRVFLESSTTNDLDICLCLSKDDESTQISFVNSAFCDNGGTHVDYLKTTIAKKLIDNYKLKKDEVAVKPEYIKRYMWLFIKTNIKNPAFESQSKRKLSTPYSKFGIKYDIPDDFIKKAISVVGIMDKAKSFNDFKLKKTNAKNTDGKKTSRIHEAKLIECEYAGKKESDKAILIFTEGDSALGFFRVGKSGLSEEEQKCFAGFPLKGKILNTQKASDKKISENEEIVKIKKLIGLVDGKKYTKETIKSDLRYGRVMFLADADTDGDHIKGLCMSFIYNGWPELIELGYVCSFPTPVIKVWEKKNKEPKPADMVNFYSQYEYDKWLETVGESKANKWTTKYYKGLATHEPEECVYLFKTKLITNYYYGDNDKEKKDSKESLEMVFGAGGKKKTDERKNWLLNSEKAPLEEIPYNVPKETIKTFIDYRLIKHCKEDNIRSIPNLYDGLKPAQRKALYSFIYGDNSNKTIKVSSLTGDMTKNCAYHHGEMSANSTIINLAQDYVGSGNLNLLKPVGLFGTRAQNGDDHGAARYISVGNLGYLEYLFNKKDLAVLKHNYDDGKKIEPEYFMPILPIVLLTGAQGIGTGWSTTIYAYNPTDVINNLKRHINGEPMIEMTPWYRGFKGKIQKVKKNEYIILGNYKLINDNEIEITELPVGDKKALSYNDYKIFLSKLAGFDTNTGKKESKKDKKDMDDDNETVNTKQLPKDIVLDFTISNEMASEIQFNVVFKKDFLNKELTDNNSYEFEKKMKLGIKFTCNNMFLNTNKGLKHYSTPEEIISDFYTERYKTYKLRIAHILKELKYKLLIVESKYRFINDIIENKININKKRKDEIIGIFEKHNYVKLKTNYYDEEHTADYDYLLSIRIDNFTYEKLTSLEKDIDNILKEIQSIEKTTIEEIWLNELDEFEAAYNEANIQWMNRTLPSGGGGGGAKNKIKLNMSAASKKKLN